MPDFQPCKIISRLKLIKRLHFPNYKKKQNSRIKYRLTNSEMLKPTFKLEEEGALQIIICAIYFINHFNKTFEV